MAISQDIMDYVEQQINASEANLGEIFGRGVTYIAKMNEMQQKIIEECGIARARIDNQVTEVNAVKDEVTSVRQQVIDKMAEVDAKLDYLNTQSESTKGEFVVLMDQLKAFAMEINDGITATKLLSAQSLTTKVQDWAAGFQARNGGLGSKGEWHFGTSSGKGKSTLDKKEVNVWNLPESLSKADFGFWLDSVDNQLEEIHGFSKPEIVLVHIRRRMETSCTLPACDQVNKNCDLKICDFGLARVLSTDEEETSRMTLAASELRVGHARNVLFKMKHRIPRAFSAVLT